MATQPGPAPEGVAVLGAGRLPPVCSASDAFAFLATLRSIKTHQAATAELDTPPSTATTFLPPGLQAASAMDPIDLTPYAGRPQDAVAAILGGELLRSRRPSPLRTMGAAARMEGADPADFEPAPGPCATPMPTGALPTGGRTSARGGPSRYRGVVWHKSNSKWEARIYEGGKQKFLGYFTNEDLAAVAYDDYAVRLHGNTAKLNFPDRYAGVQLPPPSRPAGGAAPASGREKRAAAARNRAAATSAAHDVGALAGVGNGSSPTGRRGGMRVQPVKGSSRFRGVSWNSNCAKWRAQVWKGSEVHHLGYFEREDDAARAYDEAVLRIRGPEAPTNYPRSEYGMQGGEEDSHQGLTPAAHPVPAPRRTPGTPRAVQRGSGEGEGMLGVSWAGSQQGWLAELWDGKRYKLLGAFATAEAAAKAYDVACLERHGADALTNFPLDYYQDELAALALTDLCHDPAGKEAWWPRHTKATSSPSAGGEATGGEAAGGATPRSGTSTVGAAAADALACEEMLPLPSDQGPVDMATAVEGAGEVAGRSAAHPAAAAAAVEEQLPTSAFVGVAWDAHTGRWFSQIQHRGRRHFLGHFDDQVGAAKAYDHAALHLHGQHAALNFPPLSFQVGEVVGGRYAHGQANGAASHSGAAAHAPASAARSDCSASASHSQAAMESSDISVGQVQPLSFPPSPAPAPAPAAHQDLQLLAHPAAAPQPSLSKVTPTGGQLPPAAPAPTPATPAQHALFNFLRAMGHPATTAAVAAVAAAQPQQPQQPAVEVPVAPAPAPSLPQQQQWCSAAAVQAMERLRTSLLQRAVGPAPAPAPPPMLGVKRSHDETLEAQQRSVLAALVAVADAQKKARTWTPSAQVAAHPAHPHRPTYVYSMTVPQAQPPAQPAPPAAGQAAAHS